MKRIVTTMAVAILIGVAGTGVARAHEASHTGHPPDQLGTVHFANSCSPAVQEDFSRAMALLHSFWANDAIKGFNKVLERDPDCAIAYWGIAVSHQQNPLTAQQPGPAAVQQALAAIDKAKAIGAKTQRERDYIAA